MSDEPADPVELTIPGDPQSKARPRVYHGHGITPKATLEAEERIARAWRDTLPDQPAAQGPVAIGLTFWMATRRGRDWDNLAKLFTDALNGIAWMDDRQIEIATVTVRRPDRLVPGRNGRPRRRTGKDPLTWHGREYHPHTHAVIHYLREYTPTE